MCKPVSLKNIALIKTVLWWNLYTELHTAGDKVLFFTSSKDLRIFIFRTPAGEEERDEAGIKFEMKKVFEAENCIFYQGKFTFCVGLLILTWQKLSWSNLKENSRQTTPLLNYVDLNLIRFPLSMYVTVLGALPKLNGKTAKVVPGRYYPCTDLY